MISEKVEPLQAKVDELQTENKQLRAHLDELEQYGRRPIVRISGIPESPTEDTQTKILEVTAKAGIDLSADDIVVSHRVGKPRSTGHRQIIAKLKTRN